MCFSSTIAEYCVFATLSPSLRNFSPIRTDDGEILCAIPDKEYNSWQAIGRTMEPTECSVPPALARRVEKLAREERRTPAALLREMLRLYERHRQEQTEEPYTEEWVLRLMQEAQEEERLHPMTEEEEKRE